MNADLFLRYWPVAALLLLGATLRFYGLGDESLWLDEALSWQQARLPLPALLESIAADVHPPLYAGLLHLSIAVFGASETSLRLLSAICGTLSIGLTWAVGRQLAGDRAAWIAALLLALSAFAIQYSQEARMYALLCCLGLASMLTFVRLAYPPRTSHAGGSVPPVAAQSAYVLLTGLLMYSHVYGLFIVLAQNVVMLVRYLPRWRPQPTLSLRHWLLLQVALACLLAPWVYALVGQVARVQTSFWIDPPTAGALVETFMQYMGVMPALLLGAVAALAGLVVLLRPDATSRTLAADRQLDVAGHMLVAPRDTALLLTVWLVVPIGLPFLLSVLVQPIYMPRYTIASSPAWFLLIAIGIGALQYRWLRYGVLGLLIIALAAVLPIYYSSNLKTPWPAVVAQVENNANAGDLVLFHNPDLLVPWQYYQTRTDLQLQTVVAADTWQAAGVTDMRKPDVRKLARNYAQVWLVSGYDRKTAITELEIVQQLAEVLKPAGGREFDAIRVFRFVAADTVPAVPVPDKGMP